ncbi:sensor histidine kinase [Lyngbya sp. PCC 8106]|uniref:sensor histidine kinase n=1 Tax=Lyngbya sp. (strain PCC 8106) TaxID=313612 RepID=UPI0000EA8F59|nr:hybrid sensor histidine kinase/response regulator [Lyngbya sp. PCC 8106]EAW36189.1 sensory box histidine kinase [Lyngbya sp. PCC 8106]
MNSLKPSILIVDDIEDNLLLLTAILTEKGYQVQSAVNGLSALSLAVQNRPDLILLDIMMPDINGYEVCHRLKADPRTKDIPIIFISALGEVFDQVKAFSIGAVDYLTKPIRIPELLSRVKTHLSLHQLQKELKEKNAELTQMLEYLKTTQAQLIEAEKMAALGRLVAGLSHEISTPLGIGVTLASTLNNEAQNFEFQVNQDQLKKSIVVNHIVRVKRSSQILLENLQRAADLVQSLKQVSVDQSHFKKQCFDLKSYIEKVIISLSPHLEKTGHKLKIRGEENLKINSYPGAISQIVTNLVINSIIHGYQPGEKGCLDFDINCQDDRLIISYADDGCGIPEEYIDKIFEPFFTTDRSRGGSGLGLHIIYNLVTQKLQGQISCDRQVSSGTKFILNLPLELQE